MEPIEQWQKEFEDWFFEKNEVKHNDFTKILWSSWLAAKRSQPVVELPSESDVDFMAGSLADEYDWDSLDDKERCIKSFTSGALSILDAIEFDLKKHKIQYRIKGE